MENLKMRFLKDQDAEGIIHFLSEGDPGTRKLKSVLSSLSYASGSPKFFPGNKSFSLINGNFLLTRKKPAPADVYVVSPKPLGTRCLLWADLNGQIFLENEDVQLFKIDEAFTSQLMIRKDTILDCVAVRKIVRDGTGQSDGEPKGMLTFVIMDAIRVYGRHVKDKTLQERISIVQAEIMQYRSGAVNTTTDRVFDVDISKYEALPHMEVFLAPGFEDIYEYPIGSFLFKPLNKPYTNYTQIKPVVEWDYFWSEEFCFRLKIFPGGGLNQTTGHLYALGWKRGQKKGDRKEASHHTIKLTDELRTMNNAIIECRNVDSRWMFVRVRNDFKHPNLHLGQSGQINAPISRELLLNAFRNYSREN